MTTLPFYATLTVPAGTTALSPASSELSVVPGRVIHLRLYVPPGPRGEVSLWFNHLQTRLAPVPPGTWDKLDGITLTVPLDYDVPLGEERFTLYGASPAANFQHEIDYEILIEVPETKEGGFGLASLKETLSKLFGE